MRDYGNILRTYEIVEVIKGYHQEALCILCDTKLSEGSRGASDPTRLWCPNDQCSRYGLETMLGIEIKLGADPDKYEEKLSE